MKKSEIVAALIDGRRNVFDGWVQRSLSDRNGRVCTLGGILKAVGLPLTAISDLSILAIQPVTNMILAVLPDHFKRESYEYAAAYGEAYAIVRFNDDGETTQEKVVAMFADAIMYALAIPEEDYDPTTILDIARMAEHNHKKDAALVV